MTVRNFRNNQIVDHTHQEIADLLIFSPIHGIVTVAALTDRHNLATLRDTHRLQLNKIFGQLSSDGWLYNFFSMISLRSSAFNRSSAYIRFRRAFSASNSFMRLSMETLIPPYFERHL